MFIGSSCIAQEHAALHRTTLICTSHCCGVLSWANGAAGDTSRVLEQIVPVPLALGEYAAPALPQLFSRETFPS